MFSFLKDKSTGAYAGYLPVLLIAAVIGILLLLVGGASTDRSANEVQAEKESAEAELAEYQESLEKRIRSLCESVRGVNRVTVTVTLSGGFEAVYATEWKDGNEKYVILGSGSSATALYLTREAPRIEGIGIVCDAADFERARCELISLLGATFNVSTHRIYVTSAK